MECDFHLLCYGFFEIPKTMIIIFKFQHLKIIKKIFCDIFYMSYNIMIWLGCDGSKPQNM